MFQFGRRAQSSGEARAKQRGRILGPVFWYDLVRTSRHGQVIGHRLLYAGLLTLILVFVYQSHLSTYSIYDLIHGQRLSRAQRAHFAGSFFDGFMILQCVMILLLTPLYTAGAIAEEKERRTVELLFVTDLSSREIVVGTLASRLAKILLLLLTGLPILTFLAFLGGLDPGRVLAGFAASFMLMLSLGAISILASVTCRTALGAVSSSYVSTLFLAVFIVWPCLGGFLGGVFQPSPAEGIFLGIGLLVFSFVNVVIALVCCQSAISSVRPNALRAERFVPRAQERVIDVVQASPVVLGGAPDPGWGPYNAVPPSPIDLDTPDPGWGPYNAVRPSPDDLDDTPDPGWGPYDEAAGPPRRRNVRTAIAHEAQIPRPPISGHALLWKEMHVEPNFGRASSMQYLIFFWVGVLLLLVPLVGSVNGTGPHSQFGALVQSWIRGLGIGCSFVLFLIVAVSAANRVTRERERQTLDSLMTLPYTDTEVLFAKWLGSILIVRRFLLIPIGLWLIGLLTGALNLFALPLLAASFVVYLAFFASLGVWFSTLYGSSLRANLFTLLATLLFLTGSGAILGTVGTRPVVIGSAPDLFLWGNLVVEFGLGPPSTLWALTFCSDDLAGASDGATQFVRIFAAIAGLHLYMAGAFCLWTVARARFRALKGPRPRVPKRVLPEILAPR
jgi:ABC-type transport system involved in multi-copper enzyme maturation permease subunit